MIAVGLERALALRKHRPIIGDVAASTVALLPENTSCAFVPSSIFASNHCSHPYSQSQAPDQGRANQNCASASLSRAPVFIGPWTVRHVTQYSSTLFDQKSPCFSSSVSLLKRGDGRDSRSRTRENSTMLRWGETPQALTLEEAAQGCTVMRG